jgi:hypothetical protein
MTSFTGADDERLLEHLAELAPAPEADRVSVDLYLRSRCPQPGTHEGFYDTVSALRTMQERGVLADVRLSVWGGQLCLCEFCRSMDTEGGVMETVDRIRRWAETVDPEVSLPLRRREVDSVYDPGRREVLVLPELLMTVHADDSLTAVFPHTTPEASYSVADGVAAIDGVTVSSNPADSGPASSPSQFETH